MTHDALPYDSPYFTTISGRRVKVTDPGLDDIRLEDIAHGLSRVCRFGGHVRGHLSVAGHCVLVSHIVRDMGGSMEQQLHGLLHDAAEAYVGDMISPLKRQLPDFQKVEGDWQVAIGIAAGLSFQLLDGDPMVKAADIRAFHTEWRDCFPERPPLVDFNPTDYYGGTRPAEVAKELFLDRFEEIAKVVGGPALEMLGSR